MKPHIHYRDLGLRITGAVTGAYVVSQYGGNEPLLSLLLTKSFYIEFGATLVITFLIIQLVYWATIVLDRYFDWHHKLWQRILLQAAFGIALPSLLTFLLAALYFGLYDRNILETNYHLYALPFIVALISILNLYYYIRYLLAERASYRGLTPGQPALTEAAAGGVHEASAGPEMLLVRTPMRSLPVPVEDIAYFYRNSGNVYLRQCSGKDLLLAQSLDAIEPQLDQRRFFRVARHLIAHRSAITAYQPLSYGKLGLTLQPEFREEVTVSKPLARNFKSWIST